MYTSTRITNHRNNDDKQEHENFLLLLFYRMNMMKSLTRIKSLLPPRGRNISNTSCGSGRCGGSSANGSRRGTRRMSTTRCNRRSQTMIGNISNNVDPSNNFNLMRRRIPSLSPSSRSRQILTSRRFFHSNFYCCPYSSPLTNNNTPLGLLRTTVGVKRRRRFMDVSSSTSRWLSTVCTTSDENENEEDENYDDRPDQNDGNEIVGPSTTTSTMKLTTVEDPYRWAEDSYQYRWDLICLYQRNDPKSSLKEAFDTLMVRNPVIIGEGGIDVSDDNDENNRKKKHFTQVFTSTFVCPISKMKFNSGKLPGAVRINDEERTSQQGGDSDDSSEDDTSVNRWYYRKKGTAEQAAAMAALEGLGVVDEESAATHDIFRDALPSWRARLQVFYNHTFKINLRKNRDYELSSFVFHGSSHGSRFYTGWNAKFTCPVTGRTFRSSMRYSDDQSDDDDDNRSNSDHKISNDTGTASSPTYKWVEFDDGVVWYNKKSDAIHSVAQCVLKTIQEEGLDVYRNSGGEDSPASSPEEIDNRIEPLASWYKKHYPQPELTHNDTGSVDQNDWMAPTISVDDHFVVTASELPGQDAGLWWTATFICPITGERFDSGSLSEQGRHKDRHGVSWYPKEDAAILAAACRAYDLMNYRHTQHMDPRFCKEDPSLSLVQTVEVVADPDFTCLDETTILGRVEIDKDEKEISGHDDLSYSGGDDDDDGEIELEDESDDYVLELLPQRWASKPIQSNLSDTRSHHISNTLDVIAQTWLDSIGTPKKDLGATTDASFTYDCRVDPYSERESAIARALEWSKKHKREVGEVKDPDQPLFDINSQAGSLRIANLLLSSLAADHQRIPFDSRRCGVEDAAQSILITMRSSHNTMVPDGDSYAYYLKCLEGDSPQVVAHRALKLVEDMKKGKDLDGIALPDPNTSTYESVAALLTQAGLKLPEDVEFGLDERSRSSRMAFLTELSAMAHDPPSFDKVRALQLIDEMKTAGLDIDEEVLNAPLRWAGGAQLPSQTFTRAVSFDSYDKIYQNDSRFKDNNTLEANIAYDQAEAMESWIETMSSYGVEPNLQTYESLVQSWVRCGTIDGIKKAESYGRKLLDGTLDTREPLRLETFYPIISALAYYGSPEGPLECKTWIEDIDESSSELRARSNFYLTPLLAQVCCQRSHPESFTDNSLDDLKALSLINEKLRDLVEEFKSSGAAPSHDAFVLSIQASIEAFSALNQLPQSANKDFDPSRACMNQLQQIVTLYDDLLERGFKTSSDNADTERDVMDRVIRLVEHAPDVYGAHWLALREMEKMKSVSWGTFLDLSQIESGIRRLGELLIVLDDQAENIERSTTDARNSRRESTTNWKYPFPYEERLLSFSPPRTYEDVLGLALSLMEGMSDSAHPSNDADLIRLCMLIFNMIQHPSRVRSEEAALFQDKLTRILTNCRVNEKDSFTSTLINLIGWNTSFPKVNKKAELSHTDHRRAHRGMDERKFNKRRKRVRGGSSRSTLNAQKSRGHHQKRK